MIDFLSFLNTADKTPHPLTIPEYITLAKDIILAISALAAAFIAWRGLATWEEKLKGKSEYEIAKQVLKAVYKVRNAFIIMRNPIDPFEYPDNLRAQPEPLTPEQKYQLNLHVYNQRRKIMYEAFEILEGQNINAQVEWGAEFQNLIYSLRDSRNKLYEAISSKLDSIEDNQKLPEDIKYIFYPKYDEANQDIFTNNINNTVAKYEKTLRPHIVRKRSCYSAILAWLRNFKK